MPYFIAKKTINIKTMPTSTCPCITKKKQAINSYKSETRLVAFYFGNHPGAFIAAIPWAITAQTTSSQLNETKRPEYIWTISHSMANFFHDYFGFPE